MNQNNQELASTISQHQYEDEISLVDIVKVLLKRKKLLLGITSIVVFIGLFYAFSQKRVYQVETILFPPSYEDIQQLNTNDNNVKSSEVFVDFISNTKSRKLRQEFFNKFNLLDILSESTSKPSSEKNKNDIFENFSKSIKVKVDEKSGNARISLEGHDKDKIGLWLDSFVEMSNKETINQLVRNLEARLNSQTNNLKIEISSKRSIAIQRQKDSLGATQESLKMAEDLGIHEPLVDEKNSAITAAYMKGTKFLQAEIKVLKTRKADAYITGLRNIQETLAELESVKLDKDKLQAVIVDKKATVSVEPIRPQRKLIVMLSLIIGGMLGIFGVLALEFIGNFIKQIKNELDFDRA